MEEPGAGVVEEPSKKKNKRRKIPKKAATEVSGLVQGISETEAQRVQKAFEDGREPSDWTRTRSSKGRKRGKRCRSPKEAAKEVSQPVRGILEGQRTAGKQAQAHSANPTPGRESYAQVVRRTSNSSFLSNSNTTVPPRRKRLREESTCHVVEGGGKRVKSIKGGEVEELPHPEESDEKSGSTGFERSQAVRTHTSNQKLPEREMFGPDDIERRASRVAGLIKQRKMPDIEEVSLLLEGVQTLLREKNLNKSRQEKARRDAAEELRSADWKGEI